MTAEHDDLDTFLEALWHRHAPRVRERVALLEVAAADPSPARLAAAEDAAHKLTGSLGTFGRGEAGEIAARLEGDLARGMAPDPALVRALRSSLFGA